MSAPGSSFAARAVMLEASSESVIAWLVGASSVMLARGSCSPVVRLYVQGCRSDVLIGESVQTAPARANGQAGKNGDGADSAADRWSWVPLWLRRKKDQ